METEFTVTEESIRDIVMAEVQCLGSDVAARVAKIIIRLAMWTKLNENEIPHQKAINLVNTAKVRGQKKTASEPIVQQQSASFTAKKRPRQRSRPQNLDCRTRPYDKWLFSMAERPLYDLLARNSGIHNFTSFFTFDW